jgi:hypothetical protein
MYQSESNLLLINAKILETGLQKEKIDYGSTISPGELIVVSVPAPEKIKGEGPRKDNTYQVLTSSFGESISQALPGRRVTITVVDINPGSTTNKPPVYKNVGEPIFSAN